MCPSFLKLGIFYILLIFSQNIAIIKKMFVYLPNTCTGWSEMKDVCVDCKRATYWIAPCEQWLIEHEGAVFQNELIHVGGFT